MCWMVGLVSALYKKRDQHQDIVEQDLVSTQDYKHRRKWRAPVRETKRDPSTYVLVGNILRMNTKTKNRY